MAIPDFQSLMLPFLEGLSDGKERRVKEMVALLAEKFHVSEEELLERLHRGTNKWPGSSTRGC